MPRSPAPVYIRYTVVHYTIYLILSIFICTLRVCTMYILICLTHETPSCVHFYMNIPFRWCTCLCSIGSWPQNHHQQGSAQLETWKYVTEASPTKSGLLNLSWLKVTYLSRQSSYSTCSYLVHRVISFMYKRYNNILRVLYGSMEAGRTLPVKRCQKNPVCRGAPHWNHQYWRLVERDGEVLMLTGTWHARDAKYTASWCQSWAQVAGCCDCADVHWKLHGHQWYTATYPWGFYAREQRIFHVVLDCHISIQNLISHIPNSSRLQSIGSTDSRLNIGCNVSKNHTPLYWYKIFKINKITYIYIYINT